MKTQSIFAILVLLVFGLTDVSAQIKHPVTMTGQSQVPRVHTPALGYLEVWVESDTLFVSGEFSDLRDPYLSSFIHYGEKGKKGNQFFSLHADLSEDHKSGTYDPEKNKFYLRSAIRQALKEGNLYINIASHGHRQGEIRGQIPGF